MAKMSEALRVEYQQLFDTCQIRDERRQAVDDQVSGILASRARYEALAQPLSIPWFVIGAVHSLECGLSFAKHLHNGDPLTARTTRVPKGYPKTGNPPFSWEGSARDALALAGYTKWTDWSVPGILFKWESYNGMGYRLHHPEVKSPYLWSFTNHYTRGKYESDGVWNANLVSRQIGAAALLRRLAERGAMDAESHPTEPELMEALQKSSAFVYQPRTVQPGGTALQKFLNRFPGIFLREDGKLGELTSNAFKQVFGQYLAGDPRIG